MLTAARWQAVSHCRRIEAPTPSKCCLQGARHAACRIPAQQRNF